MLLLEAALPGICPALVTQHYLWPCSGLNQLFILELVYHVTLLQAPRYHQRPSSPLNDVRTHLLVARVEHYLTSNGPMHLGCTEADPSPSIVEEP